MPGELAAISRAEKRCVVPDSAEATSMMRSLRPWTTKSNDGQRSRHNQSVEWGEESGVHFQRAMRILGPVLTSVSEESDGQKAHKRGRMDLAYVSIPPSAEELNGVLEHGKILPKCRSPEVSSGQEADGCAQGLLAENAGCGHANGECWAANQVD